jgi:hypothetical protein
MARRWMLAIAMVWTAGALGCNKPVVGDLPPLQPAKGTVVRAGKPLADCIIRFLPAKDDPTTAFSSTSPRQRRSSVPTYRFSSSAQAWKSASSASQDLAGTIFSTAWIPRRSSFWPLRICR